MKCPNCGSDNPPLARTCDCGCDFITFTLKCPNCGLENPALASHCECGHVFQKRKWQPESKRSPHKQKHHVKRNALSHWWPKIVDLESAAEASKQGIVAAILVTVFTAGAILFNLLEAWSFADAFLFAIIAWGIHRKSRSAALSGLLLYLLERVFILSINGLPVAIILTLMFVNSVRGTFAYHKFHAQLSSNIFLPASKIPELPSLPMPVKLLGGVFLVGCVGILLSGLLLGPAVVLEGDQLSADQRATIESLMILEPNERILYFYSDLDIREGFYMLTDQALILWGEEFMPAGKVLAPAGRLPLSEITFIGVHYSDFWLEDSLVSVDCLGWNYMFPLSSENGGDRSFITELEKLTGLKSSGLGVY